MFLCFYIYVYFNSLLSFYFFPLVRIVYFSALSLQSFLYPSFSKTFSFSSSLCSFLSLLFCRFSQLFLEDQVYLLTWKVRQLGMVILERFSRARVVLSQQLFLFSSQCRFSLISAIMYFSFS